MAFFKKTFKKISGLWYPQAVTVGKPVTTDEVSDRLADISTVSRGDTYAVVKNLGGVLADFMAQGRTVKIDGIGTFYYTINSEKGVDKPEKVTAAMVKDVRVRFIPEASRTSGGQVATRSLVSHKVFWEEWQGKADGEAAASGSALTPTPGSGGTPAPGVGSPDL